ncbi:MAG: cysteine hydrolase family protein [Desulfomonilia bacterium]
MKPAVIVVDMLKDSFREENNPTIAQFAREIAPNINRLTEYARSHAFPVVFANDSFLPGDFIFKGRMNEHSIRGTEGAEVSDALAQSEGDIHLPKRRFSAFFKTDLEQTLRLYGVQRVIISGLLTHWCVLSTALDALALDFGAYIIKDCCASFSREAHEAIVKFYGKSPLYPLFKIISLDEFFTELESE